MEGHGFEKYKDARLIATLANRSWSLLSAEVRSHEAGEIGAFTPQNAFITQTIRNTRSNVSIRASGGVRQEVAEVTPGTIWLCPAGICEEATRLIDDFPEVLHVYLPPHSFLRHICEAPRPSRVRWACAPDASEKLLGSEPSGHQQPCLLTHSRR
jgi:AraC family transcriptional regulator